MKTTGTTSRRLQGLLAGAALLALSSTGWAQLGPYSQDFEGLTAADTAALTNDGWQVFGNVFDAGGGYLFGYGPFGAPNDGANFSAIAIGEGGPDQGAQQLSVFSDYSCCQMSGNGHFNGTDLVESNVFQERTITAADVGATYVLTFDAKANNLAGASSAVAFIKTVDPNAGSALTNNVTVDMTSLAATWETYSLSITINASLPGQLLQFGFASTSSNFEGSGNYYDNIDFSQDLAALLGPYSQDFESLDQLSPAALSEDNWLVFANVFAPDGVSYLYGYGTFPAPNGTPGFSAIDNGQGGPAQGDQQLAVYNDYNNADHNVGNRIEASVFQERGITVADVGDTWVFAFDAKLGNLADASTAQAFIKTLNPAAGFATTNLITQDTTALPMTWGGFELSITIDASLPGQILQFGFSSTASNFEPSGIFYDNINFTGPPVDTDGDGVTDDVDNCTMVANPSQTDSNGDLIGNACDADINGDCAVNFGDLAALKAGFNPVNNPDVDFDGDGFVNFGDLAFMKSTFFNGPNPGPGPGAPGNDCP